MNMEASLLVDPPPGVDLGAEIEHALQACGLLAGRGDGAYTSRVSLREWNVEEVITFTTEEMIVRLGYTATLAVRDGHWAISREIAADARRSGIDTTDFAPELNRDALRASVVRLLQFIGAESARDRDGGKPPAAAPPLPSMVKA
jgi:hypothetical protein